MLDFAQYPLWINLLAFALAAVVVWLAGVRLTRHVDMLAGRTGIGRAFLGMLMLGGITSLPEVATTGTASAIGNAPLAVNNILGGVAMQVAVLAIADAARGAPSASASVKGAAVLLQGALLLLVLAITGVAIVTGEPKGLPVGPWSTTVLAAAMVGMYLIYRNENREQWRPAPLAAAVQRRRHESGEASDDSSASTPQLIVYIVLAGAAIAAAGYVLAKTGDALSEQTGLGASVVGAILVALSTSLPEISTTVAATRLGRFDMAFANVFGANLFDLGLLFLADVFYTGGPVLNEVGRFSLFAVFLGMAMTSIYLVGLLMRRPREVLRLGYDSLLVLIVYALGVAGLYYLR